MSTSTEIKLKQMFVMHNVIKKFCNRLNHEKDHTKYTAIIESYKKQLEQLAILQLNEIYLSLKLNGYYYEPNTRLALDLSSEVFKLNAIENKDHIIELLKDPRILDNYSTNKTRTIEIINYYKELEAKQEPPPDTSKRIITKKRKNSD